MSRADRIYTDINSRRLRSHSSSRTAQFGQPKGFGPALRPQPSAVITVHASRQAHSTFPLPYLLTQHIPRIEDSKMNKKIATLTLTGLLSACSLYALAAESTQGSALPPAAIPGINQGKGSDSNENKAEKKGEDAAAFEL